MIERIYTMSDIRVIGNDIFYQGVKVGSVNEDSHQALDFRNILDEGIDEVEINIRYEGYIKKQEK